MLIYFLPEVCDAGSCCFLGWEAVSVTWPPLRFCSKKITPQAERYSSSIDSIGTPSAFANALTVFTLAIFKSFFPCS